MKYLMKYIDKQKIIINVKKLVFNRIVVGV